MLGQFAGLTGALVKTGSGVFEGGEYPNVHYVMGERKIMQIKII